MREIVFLRELRKICIKISSKQKWFEKHLKLVTDMLKHNIFKCSFIFIRTKNAQKVLFFSFCCSSFNRLSYKKSLDFADFELDMIRISRSSPSFCNKKLNLFFGIWQSIEVICKTFRSQFYRYFTVRFKSSST